MNTDTYISSGILELYVAGVLTDAEMKEVDSNIQEYPRIAEEVEKIVAGVAAYGAAQFMGAGLISADVILEKARTEVPSAPKSDRRVKTNSAADSGQRTTDKMPTGPKGIHRIQSMPVAPGATSGTTPRNQPIQRTNTVPTVDPIVAAAPSAPRVHNYGGIAIAAVVLFLVSVALNGYLYFALNDAKKVATEASTHTESAAQRYAALETRLGQLEKNLTVYENKDFRHIALQGQAGYESAAAMVFWNRTTQEVKITATQLPNLPQGKVYQLWAIDHQGSAVSAGTLSQAEAKTPLYNMGSVGDASAFAITIEPQGGSTQPTAPNVVMTKL